MNEEVFCGFIFFHLLEAVSKIMLTPLNVLHLSFASFVSLYSEPSSHQNKGYHGFKNLCRQKYKHVKIRKPNQRVFKL